MKEQAERLNQVKTLKVDYLEKLKPRLQQYIRDWQDRVLIIYATIVGFEKGIKFIEERVPSETIVFSYQILTEADKAFSPENNIFETTEERLKALDIAHRIGSVLYRNDPLGWEDSQALVVFPENVPNNTLPIFYAEGVEYNGHPWRALFPRA